MDANERRRRASQEAAEWWLRLQTEDITRANREEFVDWLRESSVHVAEMLRVAQVHGALEQFQRWANIKTDGSDKDNIESFPQVRERSETGARALRTAPPRMTGEGNWITLDLQRQTIHTERGERREVTLADGSVVQVDPGINSARPLIRCVTDFHSICLKKRRVYSRPCGARQTRRPRQLVIEQSGNPRSARATN